MMITEADEVDSNIGTKMDGGLNAMSNISDARTYLK